jgi:ParB family transcriptional regulator, chromosome partitioning protein
MAEEARSRLGRGLAALIGDVGEESAVLERTRSQKRVPIEFLKPNPRNPRRIFNDAELDELASSIRERGVIQPILARTARGAVDQYEIVAGERRWRAAQRAGLHDVPIVLIEVGDREALEIAVIENVQRADLNPLEEAAGYLALIDDFGHHHDDVAKIVGRSRVHVTNTLRLLKLSEPVRALIDAGKLSAGHARLLVGQPNAFELAQDIVARGLSVRQVEALARRDGRAQARAVRRTGRIGPDPDAEALANRLTDALGISVKIQHRVDGEGILSIRYRNLEQLDEIARRLDSGPAPGAAVPTPEEFARRRARDEETLRIAKQEAARRTAEGRDAEAESDQPPHKGPRITSL